MTLIVAFKRSPQAPSVPLATGAAAATRPATSAPRPLLDRFFQAWFERAYRRWSSTDRYARYY